MTEAMPASFGKVGECTGARDNMHPRVVCLLAVASYVAFVLLKSAPTPYLLVFQAAVIWTSLVQLHPSVFEGWTAQQYIKESALLCLYVCLLFLTVVRDNRISTIVAQWGGFVNTIMIPVLAIKDQDYIVAVALILISPFVPEVYCDEKLTLQVHEPGKILGVPSLDNPMPQRWFFRLYYIVFFATYMFQYSWIVWDSYVWLSLSVLVPLIGMEACDYLDASNWLYGSEAQWFLVRLLFLINNNIMGGMVIRTYNRLQATVLFGKVRDGNWLSNLAESSVQRNLLQFISIAALIGLCFIKDLHCARTRKTQGESSGPCQIELPVVQDVPRSGGNGRSLSGDEHPYTRSPSYKW